MNPDREVFLGGPAICTTGDHHLPRPIGHLKSKDGKRFVVHDVKGPACTPRWLGAPLAGPSATLIMCRGNPQAIVRRSTENEVWRLQGGKDDHYEKLRQEGRGEDILAGEVVKVMTPKAARAILFGLHVSNPFREATTDEVRAGVCKDPEEDQAWASTLRWLRAGRCSPGWPSSILDHGRTMLSDKVGAVKFDVDEDAPERPSKRAKGSKRKKQGRKCDGLRAKDASAETLAKLRAIGRGHERLVSDTAFKPLLAGTGYREWIEDQRTTVMMEKLAEGTRSGYQDAWRNWRVHRQCSKKSPLLIGDSRDDKLKDEDDLMGYAIFLSIVLLLRAGTAKPRLFAIRYAHLIQGYADPLLHRQRLWTLLLGFKRRQGGTNRKRPIRPRQLRWIADYLRRHSGMTLADQVAIWACIVEAFFFMMRSSEYLLQPDKSWSAERVIRGVDIELRRQGSPVVTTVKSGEIVVAITSSKTDQYNVGAARSHDRVENSAPDNLLAHVRCPVPAMLAMHREFPERFKGATSNHCSGIVTIHRSEGSTSPACSDCQR